MRSSWRQHAINLVRGGLIGTVEIIPGVSGGTVALIVGIYETVISSAGHVVNAARKVVSDLPRRRGRTRAAAELRQVDWAVIVPVLIGMAVALVLLARPLEGFVHDHPQGSRGLFLGLVAASLFVPLSMVGRAWRPSIIVAALVAAVAAFVVSGLPPTDVSPTPVALFAVAAVAVSALVLPGLSGSFILLTFGLYEPTLAAINDRDVGYLGVFAVGMVAGLACFVKLLQWLLEHHRVLTLAVLTGVMAGWLRALWPWQDEQRTLQAPGDDVAGVAALFGVGVVAVVAVLVISRRVRHPDDGRSSAAGAVQSSE